MKLTFQPIFEMTLEQKNALKIVFKMIDDFIDHGRTDDDEFVLTHASYPVDFWDLRDYTEVLLECAKIEGKDDDEEECDEDDDE